MIEDHGQQTVDAVTEISLAQENRQHNLGGRGESSFGQRHRSSALDVKKILLLLTLLSVAILGVYIFRHSQEHFPSKKIPNRNIVRNTLPPYKKDALNNPAQETSRLESTDKRNEIISHEEHCAEQLSGDAPVDSVRQRRLAAELQHQQSQSTHHQTIKSEPTLGSQNIENQSTDTNQSRHQGTLNSQLQPLQLRPAIAGQLGDRNFLLTQGAVLDCVLETKLITTQPGLCLCTLTRDIYSANGRVILLDRGSKIVGHYQGNLNQGQARIFVVWTRIETPHGVIINIDSPGAGPLGEGGLGGYLDTHFWERFGGAIMLSLIDDFADVATSSTRQSQKNQISFTNTSNSAQDMAAEALKNSINIPPTLYKNQGEHIAIFVARDLDFQNVYDLSLEQ